MQGGSNLCNVSVHQQPASARCASHVFAWPLQPKPCLASHLHSNCSDIILEWRVSRRQMPTWTWEGSAQRVAHLADETDANIAFVRRLQSQHEHVLWVQRQEHPLCRAIPSSPRTADLHGGGVAVGQGQYLTSLGSMQNTFLNNRQRVTPACQHGSWPRRPPPRTGTHAGRQRRRAGWRRSASAAPCLHSSQIRLRRSLWHVMSA
jgi:hypothetical protein